MDGAVAAQPARGELWLVEFDPTLGHEQAGRRPALVVSMTRFNQGQQHLAVVLPLTSHDHRVRWHVALDPPEGGLRSRGFVMCEQLRTLSTAHRFLSRWGTVSAATLTAVEERLRLLLDL